MVRRTAAFLAALLLVLCAGAALAERPMVVDDAGIFTQNEIDRMETVITRVRKNSQIDVVVWTTRDIPYASDETIVEYADRWYEDNGYGLGSERSGVVILIDMRNRYNYISTAGDMRYYLNDSRIEDVLDAGSPALASGLYGRAALAELGRIETWIDSGIAEGTFLYDDVTGERLTGLHNHLTLNELGIALLAGVSAGGVLALAVTGRYHLRGSTYRYNRYANTSRELTTDTESFLRQTVTRTRITSNTGGGGGRSGGFGGGGSGVHFSGGGMSHGGGGRHF